jgi:hypothetical protein
MCNTIGHENEVTKKWTTTHIETTRLSVQAMTALTSETGFLIVEDIHIFHDHKLKTEYTKLNTKFGEQLLQWNSQLHHCHKLITLDKDLLISTTKRNIQLQQTCSLSCTVC